MNRPIGLIDCDGPLADFSSPTIDLVRRRIPEWKPPEQWDFHSLLPPDVKALVDELWISKGFASSLQPTEGAQEHVRELAEHHEIFVVTSPMEGSETWAHERTQWLAKHFGIDREHVVFSSTKHIIYGSYLIDDKIDHIRAWGSQWPGGRSRALLWKMWHNAKGHNRHVGADNWPEMLRLALEVGQRESQ